MRNRLFWNDDGAWEVAWEREKKSRNEPKEREREKAAPLTLYRILKLFQLLLLVLVLYPAWKKGERPSDSASARSSSRAPRLALRPLSEQWSLGFRSPEAWNQIKLTRVIDCVIVKKCSQNGPLRKLKLRRPSSRPCPPSRMSLPQSSSSSSGFRVGGFHFFADFDSGNLGLVQKANNASASSTGQDGHGEDDDGEDRRVISDRATAEAVVEATAMPQEEEAAAAAASSSAVGQPSALAASSSRPVSGRGKKRSRRRRKGSSSQAPPSSLAPPPPPPEPTPTPSTPSDAEFDLWTKPDCQGTSFENGNRTW